MRQSGRKYEATQLVGDYKNLAFDKTSILTTDALDPLVATCALAAPPPSVKEISIPEKRVAEAMEVAIDLCPKELSAALLPDLEDHQTMVNWVRDGHIYHSENGLPNCLHCGEAISTMRREQISSWLDNGFAGFIKAVGDGYVTADKASGEITSIIMQLPRKSDVTGDLASQFEPALVTLKASLADLSSMLENAANALAERRETPASPSRAKLPKKGDVDELLELAAEHCKTLNSIIQRHNQIVADFFNHQEDARISIRKHFLAKGAETFKGMSDQQGALDQAVVDAEAALKELEGEIEKLRRQVQQHGPVAEKINGLINAYLGHNELTIVPVENGYELHRHGKLVHGSPSEGEKTAIALCYFLSTLESDGRKVKDLIVVIDDPISSLDTKAMNYACALIRNRLSGAAQLIVLTHNQHCMNEFKKAWKGRAVNKDNPTARLFFVDVVMPKGSSTRSASIVKLSHLLREYDSEYHFLFQKVLQLESAGAGYSEYAFMMPNVIRRVLDVFLAFRVPRSGNLIDKLQELCRDNKDLELDRLTALERLSQVESHSDSLDDLIAHSSMTIEETQDANAALLHLMEKVDEHHLSGLRKYCKIN